MPIIKTMKFHTDLCIHGYHVYEEVWTATFGEQLYTEREYGNIIDCYDVAVKELHLIMFPQDLEMILLEILKYTHSMRKSQNLK